MSSQFEYTEIFFKSADHFNTKLSVNYMLRIIIFLFNQQFKDLLGTQMYTSSRAENKRLR